MVGRDWGRRITMSLKPITYRLHIKIPFQKCQERKPKWWRIPLAPALGWRQQAGLFAPDWYRLSSGQPGLHSETCLEKQTTNKNKQYEERKNIKL